MSLDLDCFPANDVSRPFGEAKLHRPTSPGIRELALTWFLNKRTSSRVPRPETNTLLNIRLDVGLGLRANRGNVSA